MKASITEADREAARRLLDPEVLNYYDGYDYQSPEWRDEDVETVAQVIADARGRPTPGGEERTADRLMPMEPPQKRFKVTLTIEAWQWKDVLQEIEELHAHLGDHGSECRSVMGGGSRSHVVNVRVDHDITEDQWAQRLDAYLAERKAERETD